MEALPEPIREYLAADCSNVRQPAYVRVTAEGKLVESGGALERYGLQGLASGHRIESVLPFLHELIPVEASLKLPCVSWGSYIGAADLHGFEHSGDTWFLLLDAEAEVQEQARLQQIHNELALLRNSERRRLEGLLGLHAELDLCVFEPTSDGTLRCLGTLPSWLQWFGDGTLSREASNQNPFLAAFLDEASLVWAGDEEGPLRSGPWEQPIEGASDLSLEAVAVLVEKRRLLVIKRLGERFAQQRGHLQLARESQLLYQQLRREIELKEILLHCIVHDLLGPLTAMKGTMDIMLEELAPDSDMREFAEAGIVSAQSQENMIRGLLDAFSADARALNTFSCTARTAPDVVAIAQGVVNGYQAAYQLSEVKLAFTNGLAVGEQRVVSEDERLERVFANLLENALRHTPRGRKVTVGLEAEGEIVCAYVDDEGHGLESPDMGKKLFQRFSQGTRSRGKVGLGLYFCRIMLERWGGSIGCEQRAEGGSRFWFRLKCLDAHAR